MITLTRKQAVWLRSKGDRGYYDVLRDNKGLYVLMLGLKGKNVKVYLPDQNYDNQEN